MHNKNTNLGSFNASKKSLDQKDNCLRMPGNSEVPIFLSGFWIMFSLLLQGAFLINDLIGWSDHDSFTT